MQVPIRLSELMYGREIMRMGGGFTGVGSFHLMGVGITGVEPLVSSTTYSLAFQNSAPVWSCMLLLDFLYILNFISTFLLH